MAVVGAGPGGLSAALWCDELGIDSLILESSAEAGGQLLWTHNRIDNYIGLKTANGVELRDLFIRHTAERKIPIRYSSRVSSVALDPLRLKLGDGTLVLPRAVIIATGVRRNQPNDLDLEKYKNKGLLVSGKRDKHEAKGATAVVVGGGDAAFENALILSETADKVLLVHRRDSFRARPEFTDAVAKTGNIEIVTDSEVTGISGEDSLKQIEITYKKSGETSWIEAQALIFRIGVRPNSELVSDLVSTDSRGYIRVDSNCRTSVDRIYAVGDVANPESPTVSTAAGMGATAVKALFSWFTQRTDIQSGETSPNT